MQPYSIATDEMIAAAEADLGVTLPDRLKQAWKTYNCIDLPGYWRVFPVFDKAHARKTAGHIVYENLRGAWGMHVRELGLITLADNGTGNQLVLRVTDGVAGEQLFHWQHDSEKLKPHKPGLDALVRRAAKLRGEIDALRERLPRRT